VWSPTGVNPWGGIPPFPPKRDWMRGKKWSPFGLKAEAPSPKQNTFRKIPIPALKSEDFAEGIKQGFYSGLG